MEKILYKHQQKWLDKNQDRALLLWETGLGKSVAGCVWLKKRPNKKALVVCPLSIIKKWQRDLEEWEVKADVVSRDNVKKLNLNGYKAIILDEAQDFASPLFDKSRSQRATVIYNHIKNHKDTHILLLSATPVRSMPFNAHTLACYLGVFWDVKQFRDKFYYFTNMFGRFHYEKKKDWRIMIRPYIEKISDIVLMSDVVDVPIQHEQVIDIPWTKTQEKALQQVYLEPVSEWHERHRAEQREVKFKKLNELLSGYRKAIVVCYYREQIDNYVKWIGEDRQVFVLHGGITDQDAVIEQAKQADDCVFLIQASMGAGFDASEFSVVFFAGMSFKYVDFVQMKGRVKRINNLHENTFIYLLNGKCDNAVYEKISAGKDFDPIEYLQLARPTKEIK